MTTELRQVSLEEMAMTYGATVLGEKARKRAENAVTLATAQENVTVSFAANSQEQMLAVLRDHHVLDAEILTEAPPYFWPAEISSSRRDSYDTAMDPETTLKNFVEDSINGVAFCDSHTHSELAFGRSFAAIFIPQIASDDESIISPARVIAGFYTLAGLKLNRVSTDDLIKGIRGGLTKDVSVGFKPGNGFMYRCSICSRDMMRDWDCEHIPGFTYETTIEATGQVVSRVAIAWIVNARLSEVSAAYDGATPQAMILKATLEAQAGRLPASARSFIESRCRLQLPARRASLSGISEKESRMEKTKEQLAAETRAAETHTQNLTLVRSVLKQLKLDETESLEVAEGVEKLRSEVVRLKPLAEERDALRKEIIDEALAEGGRALGDDFKEAEQRSLLELLPTSAIKTQRSNWASQAKGKLKGSRASSDDAERDDETDESTTRAEYSESICDEMFADA
jgi:hypothetical protein